MLSRRRFDRSGVSEVLGTILVLLITVILFASIIVWVFSIPTPTSAGRVNFDGSLKGNYVNGTLSGAFVNVTHLGGDDLTEPDTRILLTIDGQTHSLRTRGTHFDGVNIKSYGIPGPDNIWHIGETWSYLNESIAPDASVSVMVVDLTRGTVLWDKDLLGAEGTRAPLFLDKWVDGNPATASRDSLRPGDTFTVHAKLLDPDRDLNPNSVFAHFTFLPLGPKNPLPLVDTGNQQAGDRMAGDSVFSGIAEEPAKRSWDGGIILLNATDQGGRETKTRLALRVVDGDTVGQVTGPEALSQGSALQRFEIYNETAWVTDKYNAQGTRTFKKGEIVVVVVASKYLPNLDLANKFRVYDQSQTPAQPIVYGNAPYNDPVSTGSVPSSNAAFTFLEFLGGFYVYIYQFNTDSDAHGYDGVQLAFGSYPVEIDLKASVVDPPKNRFYATDSILITDENGNAPSYPRLLFFKDSQHTQPATSFHFSERLYVVLEAKSTDGTFKFGDVIIQDFLGGIQIWAPPGNPPVSAGAINNSGLDLKRYAFSVDLASPNMDAWLFGSNSYSFRIRSFTDLDESYSSLTRQVEIRGPLWLLDIMNAIEEFQNPMGQKLYGFFYANDESWRKTAYEVFDSTPQQQNPSWGTGPFFSIAMGDFDGDGDLDAVVGIKSGGVLVYRNQVGDGSEWQRIIVDDDAGGEVHAVAAGDVDGDGDDDIVAGTVSGRLWLYKNDGYWTPTLIDNVGGFTSLEFADVDGDGDLDLLAGNRDKNFRVYFNDGRGVFGTTSVTPYYPSQQSTRLGTLTGNLTELQVADDVYQSVTEVLTNGTLFEEHITDGVFLSSLNAWPTQVLTQTQGQAVWDSDSATADGSGSLRAENTQGTDTRFAGYREQVLAQSIEPGTNYTLTLNFRKSWTGAAPDVQRMGVQFRYEDGSIQTVWEDGIVQDSAGWMELRVDDRTLTGRGKVVAVRLAFNLDGASGTTNQARLWFDDVAVQAWQDDGETSRLDHTWTFTTVGVGGTTYRLRMQSHHTGNLENDDFAVYYSLDNRAWIRMFTVTQTTDDDTYQAYVLPTWIGGQDVHVRVLDTSWAKDRIALDSLHVDHLLLERFIVITPNSFSLDLGSEVLSVAAGDINGDGAVDVAAGLCASKVAVLLNAGTGTSWSRTDISSSGCVRAVDLADFDGDGDLDVAAGTEQKRVHVYWNANGLGTSWTEFTLEQGVDKVFALKAGDVNGDGWNDIVIGTNTGNVYLYENHGPAGWTRIEIDNVAKNVYGIALGDADRGIVP